MSHVIIGTAGHIDHGKTALVKALTGTDTDRLPEEKSRGVTIDIGFAFLGDDSTIIDVPGHERFIKNMVTGVSTISYVMLVVAADDGVMPQTIEHLDILSLLGVDDGLIALNKIDLVEDDWLDLVEDDVARLTKGTFLENAPLFRVSAVTGQGIDELKQHLEKVVSEGKDREDRGYFRLPVDRSFSVKGFGTVVTGSVISGSLEVGDTVEILPEEIDAKIRGVQKHNTDVPMVVVGDRAALNLSGVTTEQVRRGDHIAAAGYLKPASFLQARLKLLKSAPKALSNRTRVRLHLGTGEVMARVALHGVKRLEPGEEGVIELRLEKEAAAAAGDRFIIRRYSPPLTVGGGRVLLVTGEAAKGKDARLKQLLGVLSEGDGENSAAAVLDWVGSAGASSAELGAYLGVAVGNAELMLNELQKKDQAAGLGETGKSRWFAVDILSDLEKRLTDELNEITENNPLSPGIKSSELKNRLKFSPLAFDHVLNRLQDDDVIVRDGELLSIKGERRDTASDAVVGIEKALLEGRFASPTMEELAARVGIAAAELAQVLKLLIHQGKVVRLEGGIFMHLNLLDELREAVETHFTRHEELSVAVVKEMTGTSRKYAIPLLNWLDDNGVTLRKGNVRVKG